MMPSTATVSTSASLLLVVLALLMHFFHGFQLNFAPVWSLIIPAHLIFVLFMTFVSRHEPGAIGWLKQFGINALVVVVCVGITFLLVWVANTYKNPFFEDFASFLLLLFPPLVYYIIFSADYPVPHWLQTLAAWVIVHVVILFVLATVGSFAIPIPDSYQGLDAEQGFKNTWDRLHSGVKDFWAGAYHSYNQTKQRLDPFYYTGQVEKNKDNERLGVRLVDVEPIDPYFFPENTVRIGGSIEAYSFLSDSITVAPFCHVSQRAEVTAYADPVTVIPGSYPLFECSFPPETFDKGIYPVEVKASFTFETWADISYEFVTQETLLDYARLGADIHQALDIDKNPVAIYTDGPVRIGMGGAFASRMPIVVTDEEPFLQNAHLGFTVESAWPKGKIDRVNEFELKVPNEFLLTECNRGQGQVIGPTQDPEVPSYDSYTFVNVIQNATPYTSVRCQMTLKNKNAFTNLLAGNKATRTFIARANYDYTLSDKTEFRVEG